VSEFDEWNAYFEQRMNYPERADYYAAATIRAIFASQGAKVSRDINDFLLSFRSSQKSNAGNSEDIWLSIFGIDKEQAQ
jgi:hypothetical protein